MGYCVMRYCWWHAVLLKGGDECHSQLVTACPVGDLLKGEVMGSRCTNNLIMELVRTHKGGVGVDALQRCEPGVYGTGCHRYMEGRKQ